MDEPRWARRIREEVRILKALALHTSVRFHRCAACEAADTIEGFVNDAEAQLAELRASPVLSPTQEG